MGWRRYFVYLKYRILRLRDTPRNIAVGLAAGAAMSFSPFMGTHIMQAMLVTYVLRGNILAGVIGTIFGNPWTFPFIWLASLKLGAFLFALFGVGAVVDAGIGTQAALPNDLSLRGVWDIITNDPMRLFLPWLVGGYILAALTCAPFYMLCVRLINKANTKRGAARKNVNNTSNTKTIK